MPKAQTITAEMEIAHRVATLDAVQKRMAAGRSQNAACQDIGVKPATYVRWRELLAAGGREALRPGKSSGRTPLYVPTAAERKGLRNTYVRSNRAKNKGSKTTAARRFAMTPECSPEGRAAILKPRSSKHTLTSIVRRSMDMPDAVTSFHRSPTQTALGMAQRTGSMRVKYEVGPEGHLVERRLIGGERQSWDDGSINQVCTIPWPLGGCKCSDTFGVKVGRFQTLLGIDDASDFCPGFSFIIRAQASYRAVDIAAAMSRVWADDVRPEHLILERGIWESNRAKRFYEQTGVRTEFVHTPNQKLVENYWNRLWTQMSLSDGQIGRYRGEMERENDLLTKCLSGSTDPRKHFPTLESVLNTIESSIVYLNECPVESPRYGTWIPRDRYRDDLAENPRPTLARELGWMLAPEQRVWKVRKNGVGGGAVPCPLGPSIPYYFACEGLWDYIGAEVVCYFDPYLNPVRATIVLNQAHKGRAKGTIISTKADVIVDVPMLSRLAESWSLANPDGQPLERALRYRQAYFQAVRTEYRSIGFDGRRKNAITAVDDGAGQRLETARPVITLDTPIALDTPTPSTRYRRGASAVRSRGSRAAVAVDPLNANEAVAKRTLLALEETERLNRVQQLEEAANRSGSFLSI